VLALVLALALALAMAMAMVLGNMTATQFKARRHRLKLSQEELGLALNLTRMSIWRIEAGRQRITDWTAVKLGSLILAKKLSDQRTGRVRNEN